MRNLSSGRIFRISSLFFLLWASPTFLFSADMPQYVPGRLIVGLRRGTDSELAGRTLRQHRATIHRQLPSLNANVVDVPEAASEDIIQSLRRTGLYEYVERDYYARTAATPNDPLFTSQWHLTQIQAPQAWSITTGSSSVIVAVIDSGIDTTHPDLAAKLVPGWNYVSNSSTIVDNTGHGTAVAGAVAAISNNSLGVAGVSWASLIMPLVVVDSTDYASYSNIAAAIQYAADHNARVINLSLGGSSPSSVLQNAVNYAWSKGSILVASAMNNGTTTPYYPAACTNVIAVSATDNTDSLASFSNYGNWITLAAPGTNILTTTQGGGDGYWYGTSFSSPIAAGVAALAVSVNPSLSNSAIVSLMEQNADDIGAPGYDSYFGWGRINAYRTVAAAQKTLTPVAVSVTPNNATLTAGQTVQLSATVTGTSNLVTWSVGSSAGTVSSTGLYTAPATVSTTQMVTITATVAGAAASATITLNPPATTTTGFTPIRVNAGGTGFVDSMGQTWSADQGYAGGYTWSISNNITNTSSPALYQTCRYGPSFSYQFAVPNGTYAVNLRFAEVSRTAAGQRTFSVSLNGNRALTNFDIFAQAGGEFAALTVPLTTTVTNGLISIQFASGSDWALVNGIEILGNSSTGGSSPGFSPILVNAGGSAFVDSLGQTWSADQGFSGGYTWGVTNPIAGTTSQALYQTCRYGPSFAYQFAVPNGTYIVNLGFAEVSRSGPGQRLFNVYMNGAPALLNFDIFGQAGGEFVPLVKPLTVTVTNGQINLQFTTGNDYPMVNSIQIVSAGS